MVDLRDDDCVETIRQFVRSNPDIKVYEYIRRGCNGDVYFGKRQKLGDDVVLKFYWSHPNYDATEEAVILQGIKHDNILEIKDLRFLPPHYAYFLTPKISGGDLQSIIDSRPISTKEALEIVAGILIGLTELHSAHQLVHRDLKPGNILIDLGNNRPIIADLGAVKKIEKANGYVTASKTTYLYLPPESVQKNEYYFKSDIYQVGLILFQLLNGFFPVNEPQKFLTEREKKQVELIRNESDKYKKFDEIIGNKIIRGKLANTDSLPLYLDTNFKKVLNVALNNKYTSRYKSASLFLKDIHRLLRSTPDYLFENELLLVKHESGKQFKIYKDRKDNYILEKCISKNMWRKDNSHNGSIESILSLARKK